MPSTLGLLTSHQSQSFSRACSYKIPLVDLQERGLLLNLFIIVLTEYVRLPLLKSFLPAFPVIMRVCTIPQIFGISHDQVLPNELLDQIVDSADKDQLSDLACVNRSLNRRAQARLFHSIRITAGSRSIRWVETLVNGRHLFKGRVLPDSFKGIPEGMAGLRDDLLSLVRELTLSGLSMEERYTANTMGGSGDDPYLSTCIVRQFVDLFPKLQKLRIANVYWSPCLEKLVSPTHQCSSAIADRMLSSVWFTSVTHGRVTESAFEVLDLAKACDTLYISGVQWDHILPWSLQFQRLVRPDIRRLHFDFPTGFDVGDQVLRRFPLLENLTHLEVHDVTDMTYPVLAELVKGNGATLRTFSLNVGRNSFPVEQWRKLSLNRCKSLIEVHLTVELCTHKPHDTCAGKETLKAFCSILPSKLQALHIHAIDISDFPFAFRSMCDISEWADAFAELKTIRSLNVLELTMSDVDVHYDPAAVISWKEHAQKQLPAANISSELDADIKDVEFYRL
ncbi:hypothetical protein NM688_g2315 [Phlebia brevispora]|uniref:Uncharacterized protein n=1 Tax=Phlebia brevispora TaxID=194682 RepID=A0ACC1T8X9_9APHY|nr:hypothetical protein NM688_g2315 [Phlebia brevispora]